MKVYLLEDGKFLYASKVTGFGPSPQYTWNPVDKDKATLFTDNHQLTSMRWRASVSKPVITAEIAAEETRTIILLGEAP